MTTRPQPLVLDVLIAHFPYGGNGATSSEAPEIRRWEVQTILKAKQDPRIGRIDTIDLCDTPIPMTRNRAVRLAQEAGKHLLLMIDSDQNPMRHANDAWHKPFWDVAIDTIHSHYQAGPLVIGAPYCGPPPKENVYVFQFEDNMTGLGDETTIDLKQYTRSQAALMTGVGEVGALPTGMIMFDMRVFDIYKPSHRHKRAVLIDLQAGKISLEQAEYELLEGWFHYEWVDGYADRKGSTEDVCSTRDLAMAVWKELGYNPLRCAWDSWIGHKKPWDCGKPALMKVEQVSAQFQNVVRRGDSAFDKRIEANLEIPPEILARSNGNGKHVKKPRAANRR